MSTTFNKVKHFAWTLGLAPAIAPAAEKPNIIIIMADDMGYSDIGCYGGEINTPSIDALAANGIRYTNFYNGARSCPTRASLLSGLYAHKAGMGWMTSAYEGEGSYQGDLSDNTLTIAEYLKEGGYNTYMSGKWHLSNHQKNDVNINIKDSWPAQKGFDESYGIIGGSASYFTPTVFNNNTRSNVTTVGFYLTDAISDKAVDYINGQSTSNPFFMYVSYTAPHWPLHARQSDINKYTGVYTNTTPYATIRNARFAKQKTIGLIDNSYVLPNRPSDITAWDSEPNKNEYAKRMQIYAAQVDVMDEGIGRIIQALNSKGMLNNTLIFFLSDNGACAEPMGTGAIGQLTGQDGTNESYRRAWAWVSNTPYQEYKRYAHEGGIKTPLIVHWPNGITCPTGGFERSRGHVMDIFKTISDITQIPYPATYNGNTILPLQGSSMLPNFSGTPTEREPIFWEHQGNLAVRIGDWKLVTKTETNPPGTLELYNLDVDPTETNDLAASNQSKVNELWDEWFDWAVENDVFPLSTLSDNERLAEEPRYLNGEFNAGLYGWKFVIAGSGDGNVSLNSSNVISGKYSAEVTVIKQGGAPNNVLLHWPVSLKQGERCKLRFKVKADRAITMPVRLEENGGTFPKIIDKTVTVTELENTFEFDSSEAVNNTEHRVGFYFGSCPNGTKIWIDAVELIFINQTSTSPTLSPSWDFSPVSNASYTLSFSGKGQQLWTPIQVSLRRVDAPDEIYFSQTVYFTSSLKPFDLSVPAMTTNEKLFVQFEYPAYATKSCVIQNIAMDVNVATSLPLPEVTSPYNIEYSGTECRITSPENKQFKAELFLLNGEKSGERKGKEVVFSLKQNNIYILRLIDEKTNEVVIKKLLLH